MTKEQVQELRKIPVSPEQEKAVTSELAKYFTQTENTLGITLESLRTGMGAYYHGKGGMGKSTITKAILNFLKIPFIEVSIKGGLEQAFNIKPPNVTDAELKEFFLTKTFAKLIGPNAPKVVIISEMLDADMNIIEDLKDVMESGFYPGLPAGQGGSPGDIKCLFLATGNISPEQVDTIYADSPKYDTVKAALRRFPFKPAVDWKDTSTDAFKKQLKLYNLRNEVIRDLAPTLSYLVKQKNLIIPPSLLVDISSLVKVNTLADGTINMEKFGLALRNLDGISTQAESVLEALSKTSAVNASALAFKTATNTVKGVIDDLMKSNSSKADVVACITNLRDNLNNIRRKIESNDELLSLILTWDQELNEIAYKLNKQVQEEATKVMKPSVDLITSSIKKATK